MACVVDQDWLMPNDQAKTKNYSQLMSCTSVRNLPTC